MEEGDDVGCWERRDGFGAGVGAGVGADVGAGIVDRGRCVDGGVLVGVIFIASRWRRFISLFP